MDLHHERLVCEARFLLLVVLGVTHPEFELHRLLRAVDRAVRDREDLRGFVFLVVILGIPDVREPQVRKTTLIRPRRDDPLILILLILAADQHLAIRVRELREVRRVHRVTVGVSHLALPVAEKLHVRLGDRLARGRVRHITVGLAGQGLFHDHRVAQPDHDLARVSILHPSRHQVCTCLLQRRRDRDPLVKMRLARLQLQIPLRRLLVLQVLLLVLLHQPITQIPNVQLLPVKLRRVALQIGFHVVQQLAHANLVRLEMHFLAVAKPEFDRRALGGDLHRGVLEPAPVPHDLLQTTLPVVVRTGTILLDRAPPNLRGTHVLPTVLKDLR